MPRHDTFMGKLEGKNWDEIERELVGFWLKVMEVFPVYYCETTKWNEPLVDGGWNRIVVLLELCYGKFATNLWQDEIRPRERDRACVIATSAWIDELARMCKSRRQSVELQDKMHEALASALGVSDVQRALQGLRNWRECTIWTASWDDPGTQRRLG